MVAKVLQPLLMLTDGMYCGMVAIAPLGVCDTPSDGSDGSRPADVCLVIFARF